MTSKTAGSVDLDASADVEFSRQAFARVKDPMLFDPGSNTFNVMLRAGAKITSASPDSRAFFESSMTIPADKYEFPGDPGRSCGRIVDQNCVLFDFAVGALGTVNSLFDIKSLKSYADPITGIFGPSQVMDLINHFDVFGHTATLRDDFLLANFTLTQSSIYSIEFTLDNAAATVPEPESYALLGLGLGVLYFARHRASREKPNLRMP